MTRSRAYSRMTREALITLGRLIRLSRIDRGMTAQELAERAGISRTTLSNIEKGAGGAEIGSVFEVAVIAGVPLFGADERSLHMQNSHLAEKLALLPARVARASTEPDDDF